MFEPNIFNFHTCKVTDSHFPKHTTLIYSIFIHHTTGMVIFFFSYLPDHHWFQFILVRYENQLVDT
ncbi:hypothetical protein LDENG_00205030 [Lucifuga dentata]|nr:hypothetical protein LDENG_00205030 [Lucifuga dentata]